MKKNKTNPMKRKFIKNEKGQALIEFALLLPMLLLLVLGMIEYGWLLNAKITLNSAAREGVRLAIVLNVTDAELKDKVYDEITKSIAGSGLTVIKEDITIDKDYRSIDSVDDLIVKVKGTVQPIIGLFVHEAVPMSTQARMRKG
jgi:uncharacterized protein (UPF0333 family)